MRCQNLDYWRYMQWRRKDFSCDCNNDRPEVQEPFPFKLWMLGSVANINLRCLY